MVFFNQNQNLATRQEVTVSLKTVGGNCCGKRRLATEAVVSIQLKV